MSPLGRHLGAVEQRANQRVHALRVEPPNSGVTQLSPRAATQGYGLRVLERANFKREAGDADFNFKSHF